MHPDLENKLIGTVSFWCHKLTQSNTVVVWDHELNESIEVHNILYPEKKDLVSLVWIKLLAPETLQQLQTIWQTQGPKAVDKFVSVVVTNTFNDCLRYSDVRKSETLAVSLD
jgi:hypothetical protein